MRLPLRAICFSSVLMLLSCAHGEPFAVSGVPPSDHPYAGGVPVRLTYNAGVDRDAAWLPDGSGIMYSADNSGPDGDRCLVLMPPTGGRIVRQWCNSSSASRDSFNTFDAAAVSPAGFVAYLRTSRLHGAASARYTELAVSTLDNVADGYTLLGLPLSLNSRFYTTVSQVRWFNDLLIFRADFAGDVCIIPGPRCPVAFVTSGLDLMIQSPVQGGIPSLIPNTWLASSVATDPHGDAIYYTLLNDHRIYRRAISTGSTTVVFSFPAGTIVRDVSAGGSRLVAIVNGNVDILTPDALPMLQWDRGGFLVSVDLASGTAAALTLPADSTPYAHPALSPDGSRLVVEARGDLWMLEMP